MTVHSPLPQLSNKIFITDGGLETDLVFNHQLDLPEFASYDLLRTQAGYETLYGYFKSYAELAQKFKVGLILETPTWRANSDWGYKIGDSPEILHNINQQAIKLIRHIQDDFQTADTPVIVSGCLGPRGDGYTPDTLMSSAEAQTYHAAQINSFVQAGADMVSALTLNYVAEAVGITMAAQQSRIPVSISFTVETDGNLPTGEPLAQALQAVDQVTGRYPVYYMINCAHPTHFWEILDDEYCRQRLKGIRANASCRSHAELDEAETLDDGNPHELGKQIGDIRSQFPHINIIGGCCGTDLRHIEQMAEACCR